jgi:hypothetical protein
MLQRAMPVKCRTRPNITITHCDISLEIFQFQMNISHRSRLSWEDNIKKDLKEKFVDVD